MVGSRVMGLWSNGSWYPGVVAQERVRHGGNEYFVQFDDGDTAWLTPAQVQAQVTPTAHGPAPFPGARVLGDWTEDNWYAGYVAESNVNESLFFLQFDDGDTKWLAPTKIRPHTDRPNAAPTPQLTAGTTVQGEWSAGFWYPGVVARANNNATLFFIQFDDGDQKWLPSHQLRFAQPAPTPRGANLPPPAPAPSQLNVPPASAAMAPAALAPAAAPAREVRCAYCNTRVTRNDLSRCSECGAKF